MVLSQGTQATSHLAYAESVGRFVSLSSWEEGDGVWLPGAFRAIRSKYQGGIAFPLSTGKPGTRWMLASDIPDGFALSQLIGEDVLASPEGFASMVRAVDRAAELAVEDYGVLPDFTPENVVMEPLSDGSWRATFLHFEPLPDGEKRNGESGGQNVIERLIQLFYTIATGEPAPSPEALRAEFHRGGSPLRMWSRPAWESCSQLLSADPGDPEAARNNLRESLSNRPFRLRPEMLPSRLKRGHLSWVPDPDDLPKAIQDSQPSGGFRAPLSWAHPLGGDRLHLLPPPSLSGNVDLTAATKQARQRSGNRFTSVEDSASSERYRLLVEDLKGATPLSDLDLREVTPERVVGFLRMLNQELEALEAWGAPEPSLQVEDILLKSVPGRGRERVAVKLPGPDECQIVFRAFSGNPFCRPGLGFSVLQQGGRDSDWIANAFGKRHNVVRLAHQLLEDVYRHQMGGLPPVVAACLRRGYELDPDTESRWRQKFLRRLGHAIRQVDQPKVPDFFQPFSKARLLQAAAVLAGLVTIPLLIRPLSDLQKGAPDGGWVATPPRVIAPVANDEAEAGPVLQPRINLPPTNETVARPEPLPVERPLPELVVRARPLPMADLEVVDVASAPLPKIEHPPMDWEAMNRAKLTRNLARVESLVDEGEFETAAEELGRLGDANPDSEAVAEMRNDFVAALGVLPSGHTQTGNILRQSARDGNSRAIKWLAEVTHRDDEPDAVDWNRMAVRHGDASAAIRLGIDASEGRFGTRDLTEAVSWFQRAEALGHTEALYLLAECHLFGKGIPKDMRKGVELLKRAHDHGDPRATNMLATCYSKAMGVPRNFAKARSLYRETMRRGGDRAAGNLGVMLLRGWGGESDPEEARKVFGVGADQGDPNAAYFLAKCQESGIGGPADREEAKLHYLQAANSGHPAALKWCKEHGVELERSKVPTAQSTR